MSTADHSPTKTAASSNTSSASHAADWHILGAGAMGCLWGAYLAQAGKQVELILKNTSHLQNFSGTITLDTHDESRKYSVNAILPNWSDPPQPVISRLIVSTKAQHTLAALESVKAVLAPQASIILLQNGMGIAEQVLALGLDIQLFSAVTTAGAYLIEPFHVVHAGRGVTYLGSLEKRIGITDSQTLAQSFPEKLLCKAVDNIEHHLLRKLAINSAINGLTALRECRNGKLLSQPNARTTVHALCLEASQILTALNEPVTAEVLMQQVVQVLEQTAANRSSMLQDILNHRTTEIAYINGFLCTTAKQLGIPCEANQKLLDQVIEKERRLHCSSTAQ